MAIEEETNVSQHAVEKFYKSGFYPKGDSLKNHVDPRTYDYVRRVFRSVPEAEIAKCKPWMLITLLWSPSTNDLGVEAFLMKRARINGKPILGLESFREHADVLAGMSDKQAELVLLETFIPQAPGTDLHTKILAAWRRGDADAVADLSHKMEHDLPTFAGRLVVERNRNWIPKIEHFIRDRHTYFVVAGAATWAGRMAFSDCCAPAVIRSSSYRASVSGIWTTALPFVHNPHYAAILVRTQLRENRWPKFSAVLI